MLPDGGLGATVRGVVRLAPLQVQGDMDQGALNRVLRRRIAQTRRCYEVQLRSNPGLRGRVGVQMIIDPSGRVTQAVARQNTTGDAAVAQCMVASARRMRFPAGTREGPVRVLALYELTPR